MSLCNKLFAILVLSLTVTSLFFVHSHADEELIRNVCSQADDVNYCLTLFLSDPRCVTYSVHTLAMFAIQNAMIKAQDTIDNRISELLGDTTDPVGHYRLVRCQSYYADAVDKFRSAFGFTDKSNYLDAKATVIAGADDVNNCQLMYEQNPKGESPISAENNDIGIMLPAVILTVLKILLTI